MPDPQNPNNAANGRVIVVNTDAGWDFISLVRQRAVDLYAPEFQVDFWDITGVRDEPPQSERQIWGDWPRRIDGFTGAIYEITDILNFSRDEKLSIITVIGNSNRLKEPLEDALCAYLDKLSDLIQDDPFTGINIWHVGVFRNPPAALPEGGFEDHLFNTHAFNNLYFISMDSPKLQQQPIAQEYN